MATKYLEQLQNILNQFTGVLTNVVSSYVNYKLYPDDTTYANTYNNYTNAILKCNAELVALDLAVDKSIDMYHSIINKILGNTFKAQNSRLSKIIPYLYQEKLTSKNMKIMNINLFTYQLVLNWEMFLGVIGVFFIIVLYYRKYYTVKEIVDYASKKIKDTHKSVNDNIELVKNEMSKSKDSEENEEEKE
jgi:hypothetical protein